MKERDMFHAMKRASKSYPVEFLSIETGGTTRGIPDVYYLSPNAVGWIELKVIKYRKRRGVYLFEYRPGQISFLVKHNRVCKKTFTLGWYNGMYYLFNNFVKELQDIEVSCLWSGKSLNNRKLFKLLTSKE